MLITPSLVTLLSLAPIVGPLPAGPDGDARMRVEAVESIAVTVDDLDRAEAWYTQVLDFRPEWRREIAGEQAERLLGVFGARARVTRLRLGDEHLDLIDFLTPEGRPVPADSSAGDLWFQHIAIIVSDMDAAVARLAEHGVRIASSGPQRLPDWNPNAGGIEAMYFRDPDGHFLEVLHFPEGKGDARWHTPSDRLFLGIDHTAIVTPDTDASLRFYRDTLGLRVVGASDNHGPEQDRLNGVFGARLRITTLRADAGPAVELLEYRTPRGGRPMPPDTRAHDLWHWHIAMRLPEAPADADLIEGAGGAIVTAIPTDADLPTADAGPATLARDPAGHAVLLFTR